VYGDFAALDHSGDKTGRIGRRGAMHFSVWRVEFRAYL